jgi:hypothetical protein
MKPGTIKPLNNKVDSPASGEPPIDTGEGRKGGMLGKALPFFLDSIIGKLYVRIALL